MERSEKSRAKWRFRLACAYDERRGMTLGLQIGAPSLHLRECVALDSHGPAIVGALNEEGCHCWWFRNNIAQGSDFATFRGRFDRRQTLSATPLPLLTRAIAAREWFHVACQAAHIRPYIVFESAAPQTLCWRRWSG
jgi:hypothetical protein